MTNRRRTTAGQGSEGARGHGRRYPGRPMRPRRLLLLAVAAALLAPALALAAGAPPRTELDVFVARTTPGEPTEHVVGVDIPPSAGPTQRLELLVPAGYVAALPAAGTAVGVATAT